MLQKVRVVNDVAERGVASIQNYLHIVTNEEQRQCSLKVVSDHREKFPDAKKETIVSGYKGD